MPEGDTIHRTANTLSKVLKGKLVQNFSGVTSDLVGTTIENVEARGKHLLIHFSNGKVLQTHMRMKGSWHVYRKNERWRKPEHLARVVLEVDDALAVCFLAPVVRLLSKKQVERDLGTLGPDVLIQRTEWSEGIERLRQQNSLEIGVALLNQQILSGIGNIYKSEVLYAEKVSPFVRVRELDDATLMRIVKKAAALMRASLDSAMQRSTRVYKRAGKACVRCFTKIEMKRQGSQLRSTYYCPKCQNVDFH